MRELNIGNALKIEGWMSPEELTWLAEQASTRAIIVEIGSYIGRSTRALADNTDGTVYAIDDFFGPREINFSETERGLIYRNFLLNMSGLTNVVPLRQDHWSTAGVTGIPGMVFIDGSHEYEDVARDIRLWSKLLPDNGLLCGHDYDENWPGVIRAVNELLGDRARRVPGTTIWERML